MFYLFIVLFVIVGGVLTVLTVDNLATGVSLTILGWHSPVMPLGLIIFLVFLVGALLLYGVSAIAARHDRRKIKELQKRIKDLEQQQTQSQPQPLPTPQMAMNMGPNMSSGMGPNMGQNMPPGMGPNMGPGMPPGMGPNMGPGMPPGIGPNMGPNMGPGMPPGMGQNMGPMNAMPPRPPAMNMQGPR